MKLSTAVLAALSASNVFGATVATVRTDATASPATSVVSTAPTSSPTVTPSQTTISDVPTTYDNGYPPPTGQPGPIDTQVDNVVAQLRSEVVNINARYNATCQAGCSASHIQAWGNEQAKAADNAALAFKRIIPAGYVYWWYPRLIWNLGWIWVELYYTLWFIWGRAGLIWQVVYFNQYLWLFYVSWRNLFWWFGRFGGWCFWPYWYGWFYRYYWGWGWVWWTWWRVFWWW